METVGIDRLGLQFEQWRRSKKYRGERIPESLWNQAVALCDSITPSQVSKKLSISHSELKARLMRIQPGDGGQGRVSHAGFIQLGVSSSTDLQQGKSCISLKGVKLDLSIECSGAEFQFAVCQVLSVLEQNK